MTDSIPPDSHLTLAGPAEGLYREKGSKFIARAFPVDAVEKAEAHIESLKKEFYDSRHVCFAWRIGPAGEQWRAYDAGEPAHSAGDPILNEMRSWEVTDCLVVVVRYFGGTKLGIPGLIEAYKLATREALQSADILTVTRTRALKIRFTYPQTSEVNRLLHQLDLPPGEAEYGADITMCLQVPESRYALAHEKCSELGILSPDRDTD